MAGIEFEMDIDRDERDFARSLLRLAQRLAKARGLQFTFRWAKDGRYRVNVDGQLPTMQAFLKPMTFALLAHAEGQVSAGPADLRRSIARRFTRKYAESLDQISEAIGDVAEALGGAPRSYSFRVESATHLSGRLDEFSMALAEYHDGTLTPNQVTEECHTVLELLMKAVVGRKAKGMTFREMIHTLADQGTISGHLEDDLVQMKNLRRSAKHQGQAVQASVFNSLLGSVLQACHELCREL